MNLASIPFRSTPVVWNNGRFDIALGIVPLAWLTPAVYNPRTMTAEGRARLQAGLDAFGLVDTIVAFDDGEVGGGHQRLVSELRRGAVEAPVLVVFGVPQEQRATINVLLNNPNAQGEWDMGKLTELLSTIDANGFDATLTGFDTEELAKMLGQAPPEEPNDAEGDAMNDTEPAVLVRCGSYTEQAEVIASLRSNGKQADAVDLDATLKLKLTKGRK